MSFVSAVAGPSRIPYGAKQVARVATCSAQCGARRGYAQRAEAPAGRGGRTSLPAKYEEWLFTFAQRFKRPQKGQRARWLGEDVPYATNPSFRPPPPLSNDMMNILAAELRSKKRTIGQISQAYNVSKHRLEAIRKLKAVEDEFIRQNLPLQRAYQESMETLLGVQSPVDQKAKGTTVEAQRREELSRLSHPGTAAELEEEHSFGENEQSAFSHVTHQESGVPNDAWEMKDEGVYLRERKEAAEDLAARKAAELAEVASGTDADSLAAKAGTTVEAMESKGKRHPARTRAAGKSVYRFVDTSNGKKK